MFPEEDKAKSIQLTPEQMQQLMDKVYALWLRDLKIANERQRTAAKLGRST
jgi:hypothetical protein